MSNQLGLFSRSPSDSVELVEEAKWILQNCLPPTGQILGAFSGGKDSIAVHQICREAGIEAEWHYHVTTIDPPEVRDGRTWFAGEYYATWEDWWDAWLNKRSLPKKG